MSTVLFLNQTICCGIIVFGNTIYGVSLKSSHLNGISMLCPACGKSETRVLDSRIGSDGLSIRRRRECMKCLFRVSTVEEVEILGLVVVKQGGKREPYAREKITTGLKRALYKRSQSEDRLKQLVQKIERDIQLKFTGEVSSDEVGTIVMKHLRRFDKIAYIRFASVYRQFSDINVFHEEVNALLPKSRKKKTKSSSK